MYSILPAEAEVSEYLVTQPGVDLVVFTGGTPVGRRVAELCEGFSFDPWHATADFRPLGNMMRARSHAYRLSTQERRASPEPDGTESID